MICLQTRPKVNQETLQSISTSQEHTFTSKEIYLSLKGNFDDVLVFLAIDGGEDLKLREERQERVLKLVRSHHPRKSALYYWPTQDWRKILALWPCDKLSGAFASHGMGFTGYF